MYEELIKKLRTHNGWALNETLDKTANVIEELITQNEVLRHNIINTMHQAADVIERLSSLVDHYGGETGIKNMAEINNDLWNVLEKRRWIPVTKRLPEVERKSYWVCTNTGYQCECRWTNNRFGIKESDEWGWSIFDVPQYQKVIAWMDLPEPYKPQKEET